MRISSWYETVPPSFGGYIAGSGAGVASMAGQPAACLIYLLDPDTFALLHSAHTLDNGHYLIRALDPDREYILFARDPKRDYEPVVYDYLKPANDLTHAEQEALWAQMLQVP